MTVTIRHAIPADIPSLIALERQSPSAAHWSYLQYQQFFTADHAGPPTLILVAESPTPVNSHSPASSEILGFLVASHLPPDWELENIVVAPPVRRNGLGRRLLEALLTRARETKSETVFLEVRESNAAARNLYERAGFHQTGRRNHYYPDSQEDAILYRLNLPKTFSY